MISNIPVFTKGICNFQIIYYGIYCLVGFMMDDEYALIFKSHYYFDVSYSPVYEIIYVSQVIFWNINDYLIIHFKIIFSSTLCSTGTYNHNFMV
jgi:hypothetical protein